MKEAMQENPNVAQETAAGISRRRFLAFAGGVAGAGILVESCKKDKTTTTTTPDGAVDLGTNDQGLLNYLYALSQLTATFYTWACEHYYVGITDLEKSRLADIRDHNILYRELFKNHLGTNRIQNLDINLGSFNFTDRSNVLNFSKYISDMMVSAYNGVARLFITPEYVALVAKIGAVQARHSAVINDMSEWGSFSNSTDGGGLDLYRDPLYVINALDPYFKTKISGNNLPNK